MNLTKKDWLVLCVLVISGAFLGAFIPNLTNTKNSWATEQSIEAVEGNKDPVAERLRKQQEAESREGSKQTQDQARKDAKRAKRRSAMQPVVEQFRFFEGNYSTQDVSIYLPGADNNPIRQRILREISSAIMASNHYVDTPSGKLFLRVEEDPAKGYVFTIRLKRGGLQWDRTISIEGRYEYETWGFVLGWVTLGLVFVGAVWISIRLGLG